MAKKWTASALTGGALGALDAIDGNLLSDEDWCLATNPGDAIYFYELVGDSGAAESSPDVISPDNNAGDKRWILRSINIELNSQQVGDVIAAAEAKTTLVDADGIGVSNSEDGDILVEWTFGSLKAQLLAFFTAAFNLIYDKISGRNNHGTITGASPATLNATDFTEHTGDFDEDWTATIEGLTEARPSMLFEFVVSGSAEPTVTLSGATFAFATTLNLTDLVDGTYQVVFNSVDDGASVTVYVKLMP